jgi:hypothetical protein
MSQPFLGLTGWEPGDDICPPGWPFTWPRPHPHWGVAWLEAGRDIAIGLTLLDHASRITNREIATRVLDTASELIAQRSSELTESVKQTVGAHA